MLRYLRKMEVVVRVYSFIGHSQPVCRCMSALRKVCAPWCSDMWFGWEETPRTSKVIMVSMVACGASLDDTEAIFGAKAAVRRLEIRRGCHVTVMESGKFLRCVSCMHAVPNLAAYLSSMINMSSLCPMPSLRPLLTNSFLRISPSPSASPVARRS